MQNVLYAIIKYETHSEEDDSFFKSSREQTGRQFGVEGLGALGISTGKLSHVGKRIPGKKSKNPSLNK